MEAQNISWDDWDEASQDYIKLTNGQIQGCVVGYYATTGKYFLNPLLSQSVVGIALADSAKGQPVTVVNQGNVDLGYTGVLPPYMMQPMPPAFRSFVDSELDMEDDGE